MNLTESLDSIEGRKEFAIRRRDGLVIINYLVQMPGTFDGIRKDFRGIIFDEATGKILSRPLHKFFGVGQTSETMFDRIKAQNATIFEKLDGTMIHFLRHPKGDLQAASRMGPGTAHAEAAMDFAIANGLLGGIRDAVDSGWTPIFEFCSPKYPIVVRHPVTRLVYLCSRNRTTGAYRFLSDFPDCAERYTFPFSEIMEDLRTRKDFEGFVCWLDDGTTVKAKCPWYLERHRAFDAMLRPAYKLYGLVYDGVMDDLIAAAQPHHKSTLETIYREAQSDFLDERQRMESMFSAIRGSTAKSPDPKASRKAFVEMVRGISPADLGGMMTLYDGKPIDRWVQDRLMVGYKVKYPDPVIVGSEEESTIS